ncbi:tetratricopeptide repeat protein [Bacteroidota bacterium]
MNRLLGIILILLIPALHAEAKDFQDLLKQGNQHYLDGEYELAVKTYKSIVDSGYASAELYYNLGNAHYKSHNITMALVNYERAYILNPKDKDILNNLEVAREFVVDRIDVLPEFFLKRAWVAFVKTFDADIWAIVSLAIFILSLALFLVYFFSKQMEVRRMFFWLGIMLIFLSLSTLLFAAQQNRFVTKHNQAIILTPSVAIKSSPDENSGTDLFLLHEGTKVTIADELGDWREVVLSDGNRGWLKENDLIRLYSVPHHQPIPARIFMPEIPSTVQEPILEK